MTVGNFCITSVILSAGRSPKSKDLFRSFIWPLRHLGWPGQLVVRAREARRRLPEDSSRSQTQFGTAPADATPLPLKVFQMTKRAGSLPMPALLPNLAIWSNLVIS
jgi:hypothetical protein